MTQVHVYKKSVSGNVKVANNFTVSEFACQDGSDVVFIDDLLVFILQNCRDHFGKPLIITSGYRTVSHNRNVGGASGSYHCLGMAADFYVQGVAVSDIVKYLEVMLPNTGGIGVGADYVHVDTRPVKSRWKY